MAQSILESVKKNLGISADNTAFDVDLILHINSTLATLNQLGVGPDEGFAIEDDSATWEDFLGDDPRANNVRIYTYLKVRVLFDPPTGSYHLIGAMEQQITELEWRISVKREGEKWTEPAPRQVSGEVVQEVIIVPVQDAWASGPA